MTSELIVVLHNSKIIVYSLIIAVWYRIVFKLYKIQVHVKAIPDQKLVASVTTMKHTESWNAKTW